MMLLKNLQTKIKLTKKQKYIIAFVTTLVVSISFFFFQEKILHLKNFGLLGLFLISAISSILFLPSPLLIAAVLAFGREFNPLTVAFVSSFGSAVGDIFAYLIGYTGREAFWNNKKWHHEVSEHLFKSMGGFLIFILSLIPNPFFDAIGIAAGLFLYPFKKFFIYIFLGRFIRNLLLAYLGSSF